jgi:hypothetical protein
LGKALLRRADEIQANSPKVVREATVAALSAVVIATPADTGRARSNWTVTQKRPADGVREAYSPGNKLGSGEGANAGQAIKAGAEEAVKYQGQQKDTANFITNNLPYIARLEDGYSEQAPLGMVKQGIAAAGKVVAKSKLLRDN